MSRTAATDASGAGRLRPGPGPSWDRRRPEPVQRVQCSAVRRSSIRGSDASSPPAGMIRLRSSDRNRTLAMARSPSRWRFPDRRAGRAGTRPTRSRHAFRALRCRSRTSSSRQAPGAASGRRGHRRRSPARWSHRPGARLRGISSGRRPDPASSDRRWRPGSPGRWPDAAGQGPRPRAGRRACCPQAGGRPAAQDVVEVEQHHGGDDGEDHDLELDRHWGILTASVRAQGLNRRLDGRLGADIGGCKSPRTPQPVAARPRQLPHRPTPW